MDHKKFVDNALHAADLMQGYIDLVISQVDRLDTEGKEKVKAELASRNPADIEGKMAKTCLTAILEYDSKEDSTAEETQ